MRRAIWTAAATALTLGTATGLTGCAPTPAEQAAEAAQAAVDWARSPLIERVTLAGPELLVSGVAEPGARVVLRSGTGAAFAASADSQGRFEIHMAPPAEPLLLRPETQFGQDAAPSPDRLLILAGGRGPVAVLRFGGPARRLDAAPALGAVDSDGRMRLASGQVAAGVGRVEVEAGGRTIQVAPDPDGRWRLMLPHTGGPDPVRVGAQVFSWPGDASGRESLTVEQAGGGWRVGWTGPAGARQSTWLPVAASG